MIPQYQNEIRALLKDFHKVDGVEAVDYSSDQNSLRVKFNPETDSKEKGRELGKKLFELTYKMRNCAPDFERDTKIQVDIRGNYKQLVGGFTEGFKDVGSPYKTVGTVLAIALFWWTGVIPLFKVVSNTLDVNHKTDYANSLYKNMDICFVSKENAGYSGQSTPATA